MVRWPIALSFVLAACASSPSGPQDLCNTHLAPVAGGAVELGLGSQFSPMVDGEDVSVQHGLQGLWMFVVNARVTGMNVGLDADQGAALFQILDASGNVVSLQTGCRNLDFMPVDGATDQLVAPFALPLIDTFTPTQIEGAHLTIAVDMRDRDGHEATDQRTIVAHMPTGSSASPLVRVRELGSPR
jgi:hypothetical protein